MKSTKIDSWMSMRRGRVRASTWILGSFLAVCLVFGPTQPRQEVETSTKTVAVSIPEFLHPAKAKIPLSLMKPKAKTELAAKAWFTGKKIFTPKELSFLLYQAGFRGYGHKVAFGVAMKESTGRAGSFNGSCWGLFQIYMLGKTGQDRLNLFHLKKPSDLFNPLTSAKAAYFMSAHGKVWTAWSIDLSKGKGLNLIQRFMPIYPGVVTHLPKQ